MVLLKKPKELQMLHFKDPKLVMSLSSIDQLANLTRLLKNRPRQQVLQALEKNNGMTVTDLYRLLKWDQSYASQMLKSLKDGGLVSAERDGHFIVYSVNKPLLIALRKVAEELYG